MVQNASNFAFTFMGASLHYFSKDATSTPPNLSAEAVLLEDQGSKPLPARKLFRFVKQAYRLAKMSVKHMKQLVSKDN